MPRIQTKSRLYNFRCFWKIIDRPIRRRPWSVNGITPESTVAAFSRFVGNGRADASCGSFVMWKTRVLRTMMAKRLRIIVRSVRIDDPMKTQEHNANYPVTQHVGTTIKQFGIRRSSVLKSKNKMGFLFNLFTHRKQNKTKNEENTNKQKYLKKMRVKKQ